MSQKITVIGLGFVGLTTALGLAEKGHAVIGYDANLERGSQIAAGHVPLHEPGLETALAKHLGAQFSVAVTLREAVRDTGTIFLCVGTPCSEDGAADLSILQEAIHQIVDVIADDDYRLLVIKSTVPPGSTAKTLQAFLVESAGARAPQFGLATNPEFLREGYAWGDFMYPDRIVIGVNGDRDWVRLAAIYAGFDAPVHRLTPSEAEFVKYLSNTLLATLISFSNEMSMVALRIGDIDIPRTFNILHQDKRWFGYPAGMASYVYPGCGFGGYCLPKDTQALACLASTLGMKPDILNAVIETNHRIKMTAIERIAAVSVPQHVIGILGLSFKPDSDDVRDSPAKDIIQGLLSRGYERILAHDPLAIANFAAAYSFPITYRNDLDVLIQVADVLVITTAWCDYRDLRILAGGKSIVDLRYCLA